MTRVNSRSEVAGSNCEDAANSRSAAAQTASTCWASCSPSGVSTYSPCSRTSSSSPKWRRSRASDALAAGWVTPSRCAARVTLRSRTSSRSATSRFRSRLARWATGRIVSPSNARRAALARSSAKNQGPRRPPGPPAAPGPRSCPAHPNGSGFLDPRPIPLPRRPPVRAARPSAPRRPPAPRVPPVPPVPCVSGRSGTPAHSGGAAAAPRDMVDGFAHPDVQNHPPSSRSPGSWAGPGAGGGGRGGR